MAECYHFCGQDEKSADHYLQALLSLPCPGRPHLHPAGVQGSKGIFGHGVSVSTALARPVLPHPSASADPAPAERRSWAQSCCLGRRCRPPHSTRPAAQPPAEHSKPKPPQVCSKAVSSSKPPVIPSFAAAAPPHEPWMRSAIVNCSCFHCSTKEGLFSIAFRAKMVYNTKSRGVFLQRLFLFVFLFYGRPFLVPAGSGAKCPTPQEAVPAAGTANTPAGRLLPPPPGGSIASRPRPSSTKGGKFHLLHLRVLLQQAQGVLRFF